MAIETWLPFPNDPKTDIYSTATREAVMLREVLRRRGPGVGLVGASIVCHLTLNDLFTFAGVTAVVTAVAIAASYFPALRAIHIDPITTLHSE
jgi:ABC-type lipoprotein release transport system permease subunit